MRWCFIFTGLLSWESASHLSPMPLFSVVMFFMVKLVPTGEGGEGEEIVFAALSMPFFSSFFFFLSDKLLKFFLLQCFPIWYKWGLSVYLAFLHGLLCWSTRILHRLGCIWPPSTSGCGGTTDLPSWHLPLDIFPSVWPHIIPRKIRGT